jgi:RNA polymerase sigma-70 factor (ECF subfamily)
MTLPHFLATFSASSSDESPPRRLHLVERTRQSADAAPVAPVAPVASVEHEILRALASDDIDAASVALEGVFREWYASLIAFATVLLGDRATAQDIVQVIFIDVWRRRTTLTISASIAAYLHGAIRHRVFTRRRDEANRERILGTIAVAEGIAHGENASIEDDNSQDDEQRFRAVIAAADALPPRAREVFYLRWRQGLSYKEIAAVMDISPKTAEAQMTIALRRIRQVVLA